MAHGNRHQLVQRDEGFGHVINQQTQINSIAVFVVGSTGFNKANTRYMVVKSPLRVLKNPEDFLMVESPIFWWLRLHRHFCWYEITTFYLLGSLNHHGFHGKKSRHFFIPAVQQSTTLDALKSPTETPASWIVSWGVWREVSAEHEMIHQKYRCFWFKQHI